MSTPKALINTLTKAETVALWHAVESLVYQINAMKSMSFLPEQIEAECSILALAKRALRKVNKLRRQGL
ncbi:MAG: hypothetical protein JJD98_02680 [Polaromonas sp.]|nr:hypothetical protein [Polaromonas sp.]